MSPDDPRHGTYAGHIEHAQTKTPMCQPCRDAGTRYMKRRRLAIVNGQPLTVPRIGAQRRIQALMTMGWTGTDIAHACGWADRASVLQILRPRKGKGTGTRGIFRQTDEAIRAAFADMSMRHPEHMTPARSRVRNYALRNGWAPPLAWDDIDNDPAPRTECRQPGRPAAMHAVLEDFDWLTNAGESPEKAAARVGVSLATIRDYRTRAVRREAVSA